MGSPWNWPCLVGRKPSWILHRPARAGCEPRDAAVLLRPPTFRYGRASLAGSRSAQSSAPGVEPGAHVKPPSQSVPSEEEACLALRRCDLLSRHLACKLAPDTRRRAIPPRECDVEPSMSCDKIGRP